MRGPFGALHPLVCRVRCAADIMRQVIGVFDGTTIEVLLNLHPERIRLSLTYI
jgi:hypothetical protein